MIAFDSTAIFTGSDCPEASSQESVHVHFQSVPSELRLNEIMSDKSDETLYCITNNISITYLQLCVKLSVYLNDIKVDRLEPNTNEHSKSSSFLSPNKLHSLSSLGKRIHP